MAGIKHVTVNRYNYMAHLPEDFDRILSVYRSDIIYVDSIGSVTSRYNVSLAESIPNDDDWYYVVPESITVIGARYIYFRGEYSRWWIIRKLQQFMDIYWPVKYKITYYSK